MTDAANALPVDLYTGCSPSSSLVLVSGPADQPQFYLWRLGIRHAAAPAVKGQEVGCSLFDACHARGALTNPAALSQICICCCLCAASSTPITQALLCVAGMFSEAYFIFSVGNLKTLWGAAYPECWKTHQTCSSSEFKRSTSWLHVQHAGPLCPAYGCSFHPTYRAGLLDLMHGRSGTTPDSFTTP